MVLGTPWDDALSIIQQKTKDWPNAHWCPLRRRLFINPTIGKIFCDAYKYKTPTKGKILYYIYNYITPTRGTIFCGVYKNKTWTKGTIFCGVYKQKNHQNKTYVMFINKFSTIHQKLPNLSNCLEANQFIDCDR